MLVKLEFLGLGTYNRAYRVVQGTTIVGVLKKQINQEPLPISSDLTEEQYSLAVVEQEEDHVAMSLDTIERSIKIWNEINPGIPARPFECVDLRGTTHKGWLCPFVEGRQANDEEIVRTLIDIYQRTGRIVVDAIGSNNIVTRDNGQSVCIDVGYAVKLDSIFGPLPRVRQTDLHGDREDMPGLIQWRSLQDSGFTPYFNNPSCTQAFPRSIRVIKSLLFINSHRSELRDVDFLKDDAIAILIADAYDRELQLTEGFQSLIDGVLTKLDQLAYRVLQAQPQVAVLEEVPKKMHKVNVDLMQGAVNSYLQYFEKNPKCNRLSQPDDASMFSALTTFVDLYKRGSLLNKPTLEAEDIQAEKESNLICTSGKLVWSKSAFLQKLYLFKKAAPHETKPDAIIPRKEG